MQKMSLKSVKLVNCKTILFLLWSFAFFILQSSSTPIEVTTFVSEPVEVTTSLSGLFQDDVVEETTTNEAKIFTRQEEGEDEEESEEEQPQVPPLPNQPPNPPLENENNEGEEISPSQPDGEESSLSQGIPSVSSNQNEASAPPPAPANQKPISNSEPNFAVNKTTLSKPIEKFPKPIKQFAKVPITPDSDSDSDSDIIVKLSTSPTTAKPKPVSIVQNGYVPVEEPGTYEKTPRPIKPLVPKPVPVPNPTPEQSSVEEIKIEAKEEGADPISLPPLTGKYKVTPKPGVEIVTSTTLRPPLSIAEEWNLTSSLFTLTPQGRADCECGKVPFKVENAEKAGINEYPWTVAIVRNGIFGGGGRAHCGGVLINSLYVLTTAGCLESFYPEAIQVWLTAHNTLQSSDNFLPSSERTLKKDVKEILMHPNYDRRTHDNDIALIRLFTPIDISTSSYYIPACLPAAAGVYDGMTGRVAGWSSSTRENKLCREDVPVVTNEVCNRDSSHKNTITPNQLCAGFLTKLPSESCLADAGGPLMLPNGGRFTVIGLVSHGFSSRKAYTPTVYTRVGAYADWILHNTARESNWCSY